MKTEEEIIRHVQQDAWMMDVLRAARSLQLPEYWVCAGFVRSKIWDTLHGYSERTVLGDIDVIYFDPATMLEAVEKEHEATLLSLRPDIPWSVKNQARMHVVNQLSPFTSSTDAMSKFPETATALGLSLTEDDQVLLSAPWGIEDVIQLQVKPTPFFAHRPELLPHLRAAAASKKLAITLAQTHNVRSK